MRLAFGLIPTVLLATACASGADDRAPSAGGSLAASSSPREDVKFTGEAVHGNYAVTWKNFRAKDKLTSAFSLVNESSEIGQKLAAGKATSSEIRVISDSGMAWLVDQLKQSGFYQFATEGITLANAANTGSKSGVVVVTQDGRTLGLALLGPGPSAQAYETAKQLVMRMHSQAAPIMGQVEAGAGESDTTKIFSAPKPPPLRRP